MGRTRILPQSGAPESTSSLTRKLSIRLERIVSDKYSSLLQTFINYEKKKVFITFWTTKKLLYKFRGIWKKPVILFQIWLHKITHFFAKKTIKFGATTFRRTALSRIEFGGFKCSVKCRFMLDVRSAQCRSGVGNNDDCLSIVSHSADFYYDNCHSADFQYD